VSKGSQFNTCLAMKYLSSVGPIFSTATCTTAVLNQNNSKQRRSCAASRTDRDQSTIPTQVRSDDMRKHKAVLLTDDERTFISAVHDSIRNADATFSGDPALLDKLIEAFDKARAAGLTRDELLADFIYLEIQAPGFHRHPSIRRWLRKPGAVPDERFADLMEVLRNKSHQVHENE
jgi:hypothetical protein